MPLNGCKRGASPMCAVQPNAAGPAAAAFAAEAGAHRGAVRV